ncbi:MAG: hypothetical protein L6R40_007124 [Gallowayella cf. fulva]|nr:MAG: hypothetical protein L6R40_007124 [Xanthomendoza cf. fulva]
MYRLLILLLCTHLQSLSPAVQAVALPPTNTDIDNRSSHLTLGAFPPAPPHAPRMPWNQHICHNDQLAPEMYLTFTYGRRLSYTAMRTALDASKQKARSSIASGDGDRDLPWFPAWSSHDPRTGIAITARHFRRRLLRYEIFTYEQVLQGIELLDFCGYGHENFEEMWAFVFVGGRQVGYLWMNSVLDILTAKHGGV